MMIFDFIPDGSPTILANKGVTPVVGPPPTDPLFTDARGEIRRLQMAGAQVNMLHTRAGFMRSGDLHPNIQFDFLLSGRCVLRTFEEGEDVYRILTANQGVAIGAFIPHLFEFFEDTVMMEWWDGPFKCWYFRPYRDVINASLPRVPDAVPGL